MSTQIPEETLKQWKVEINLIAEKWFTDNGWVPTESRVIPAVSIALAAKSSSYEHEQELLSTINADIVVMNKMLERENLIVKLQERIKELEAEICVVKHKNYEVESGNFDTAVAERDQLIEQAKPYVLECNKKLDITSTKWRDEIKEWFKQVEELKEGK